METRHLESECHWGEGTAAAYDTLTARARRGPLTSGAGTITTRRDRHLGPLAHSQRAREAVMAIEAAVLPLLGCLGALGAIRAQGVCFRQQVIRPISCAANR